MLRTIRLLPSRRTLMTGTANVSETEEEPILSSTPIRVTAFRHFIVVIAFLASSWLAVPSAHAQEAESGMLYRVETTDGSAFQGKLIRYDSIEIVIEVASVGTVAISKADVVLFEQITEESADISRSRRHERRIPLAQQALLQPNGFGLEPGEGEYQNVLIFFNTATIGLHQNFSVGFGIIPTFLVGVGEFPIWINPKVSFSVSQTFHLAAGGLLGTVAGHDDAFFRRAARSDYLWLPQRVRESRCDAAFCRIRGF